MKKVFLVLLLITISYGKINAQNLYLKFNLADSSAAKLHGKSENYPINRYGYWEEQVSYGFYGDYPSPQVAGSVEWKSFDLHFITVDKNTFQLIDMSEVSSYTPINIDQLAVILQSKPPKQNAEYFRSFQKIYIIEVGLPNNKAKVIEVKRCIGLDCGH